MNELWLPNDETTTVKWHPVLFQLGYCLAEISPLAPTDYRERGKAEQKRFTEAK